MSDTTHTPEPQTRPRWMTGAAIFCVVTVVFLVLRDLLFPAARGTEVWFGFELHGRLAHVTAPLHWAIFLAGAWAFWTARPWIVPAAAGYVFYIAFSHLVWSEVSPNGHGWTAGVLQALVISIPAVLLLQSHRAKNRETTGD